jgi:hypothetical protein
MGAGKPSLFRSYRAPINKTFDCTIWQAARATSAAPTFFKNIVIGEPGAAQPYVDGGMGLNNPTVQVIDEAQSIFSDRRVACIISIGTGQAKTIEIPKPSLFQQVVPLDVVNAMISIATDCEATSEAMVHRFRNTQNFYFRFNVEQGLQEVKMAQWDRLDKVAAHTKRYLLMEDVKKKIGDAVDAILQRPEHFTTAQIGMGLSNFNTDLSHFSAPGGELLPHTDTGLSVCIILNHCYPQCSSDITGMYALSLHRKVLYAAH